MKVFFLFLLVAQYSFAQSNGPVITPATPSELKEEVSPVREEYPGESEPLATETLPEPLPGETLPEESIVEQTVEDAEVISEDDTLITPGAEPTPAESTGKSTAERLKSKDHRRDSFGSLMVGYQLISSWVPFKKTVSYTQIFNERWSVEPEFSTSKFEAGTWGFDVGELHERRYSLLARYYPGNSFNWIFGPYYQDFEASAGSKIVSSSQVGSFGAEGVGASLGMANRWQFRNGITVGIDWIRLNIPLLTTKTENKILKGINQEEESEEVKEVIRKFNRIPTFVVFGLNLGYTF